MKVVYGLVMIIVGGMGLLMTACGVIFLPAQGLGLIGLVPGVLLIWLAVTIANKRFRSSQDPDNPAHSTDQETNVRSESMDDGKM